MVAMNTFKVALLAIALVFSSWSIYLNAGIVLQKEPLVRKGYFTGIMFLIQFLMAGTGIWLGYKVGSFDVRVNILISLSILLIFGLKVLLSGIRTQSEFRKFDFTNNKITAFAALAEGITSLVIGIAIGLLSMKPYLHWILIGIFLFSGVVAGLILAARMGNNSLKLRFGPVGGLLFLAAAIQLAMNLARF